MRRMLLLAAAIVVLYIGINFVMPRTHYYQEINSLPTANIFPSSDYTLGMFKLELSDPLPPDFRSRSLLLTDMSTGETFKTTGRIGSAALGDGVGVWITQPKDGSFEVWAYDFATKKSKILSHFSNNNNPNSPQVAVWGRNVALVTFPNDLNLINVDTGAKEVLHVADGYLLGHGVHYIHNLVIMPAHWSDTYLAYPPARIEPANTAIPLILAYDTNQKVFKELYRVPNSRRVYHFWDVLSTPDGVLYWKEEGAFSPVRFFRLNVADVK